MASGRLQTVVRRLRQTALLDAGMTDGELLERYLAHRDESAFATLVRRHGPMVLGVCRRVLRDAHDADDAFQATFLVLVRKAHSVMPRERVGPWLYGVAFRTSLKAKNMSHRRRAKQKSLEDVPAPPPSDTDWLALLDQEINRLPEKYRLPVVLCDLEGKTRKQAAAQLAWPEGTVATRLQHGRMLVQKRLTRFGLPVAAGTMTLAWAEATAAAAVPGSLLTATIQTSSVFAADKIAGLIPLKVVALAQGVLQAMVLTKIKSATATIVVLGALGLLLGGLVSGTRPAAAQAPPVVQDPPADAYRGPAEAAERVTANSHRLLPTGPALTQALVSLLKGTVVVRMNQPVYEPKKVFDPTGRIVTTQFQLRNVPRSQWYNLDQVEVYDTRLRKLDNKDMSKWLKEEIPALVLIGSRELDPLHLRLIKEGTLIFVLPAPTTASTPVFTPLPEIAPTVVPPIASPGPATVTVPRENPPSAILPEAPGYTLPPPVPGSHVPQAPTTSNLPTFPPTVAPMGDDVLVSHKRIVQIPILIANERRAELRELALFVSSDQGKTWRQDSKIAPTQRAFSFTAPADGTYWFRLVTVYRSGKREPESVTSGSPDLKIVIDTRMPRSETPASSAPTVGVPQSPPTIDGQSKAAEGELKKLEGNSTSLLPLVQDKPAPRITLDVAAKGLKITAATLSFLPNGHVELTHAEITRCDPGQQPQSIRGRSIVLVFDGPVRTLADFEARRVVSIQAEGVESIGTTSN